MLRPKFRDVGLCGGKGAKSDPVGGAEISVNGWRFKSPEMPKTIPKGVL